MRSWAYGRRVFCLFFRTVHYEFTHANAQIAILSRVPLARWVASCSSRIHARKCTDSNTVARASRSMGCVVFLPSPCPSLLSFPPPPPPLCLSESRTHWMACTHTVVCSTAASMRWAVTMAQVGLILWNVLSHKLVSGAPKHRCLPDVVGSPAVYMAGGCML